MSDKEFENGCARKHPYVNRLDAARTGQRVYHCKICGFWHRTGPLVKLRNTVLPADFNLPEHMRQLTDSD